MSEEPEYRPGNKQDFELLYQRSYPRLLATLTGLLSHRQAAEDCLQESFARAWRAWPRWRPQAPAEAWLHRIAINQAISHRRSEAIRRLPATLSKLIMWGAPPDTEALPLDLRTAILQLPPEQASAIVLRHLHGYSNREIGIALGIPERTVASRLAAAKLKLRALLGNAYHGGDGAEERAG